MWNHIKTILKGLKETDNWSLRKRGNQSRTVWKHNGQQVFKINKRQTHHRGSFEESKQDNTKKTLDKRDSKHYPLSLFYGFCFKTFSDLEATLKFFEIYIYI